MFVSLLLWDGFCAEVKAESTKNERELSITLTLFGETYSGIYKGTASLSLPSGNGEFISEDGGLTCSGMWRKGKLNGAAAITYSDGTTVSGWYTNGIEDGLFRRTLNDQTREDTFYADGYVCGNKCTYDNGELAHKELIVNGSPLEEFKNNSIKLTAEVLEDKSYLDHCVYLEGEVAYIGRDEEKCYCRIEDTVLGSVYFEYMDTTGAGVKQSILPNMEVGDKVRVFGYYASFKDDYVVSDTEGYGFSFPSINPVYGELMDGEEALAWDVASEEKKTSSAKAERIEYELYRQYPYHYYGLAADQKYVVQKTMRKGSTLFVYALRDDAQTNEDVYILVMDKKDAGGFLRGDLLKIEGNFQGQFRVSSDGEELPEVDSNPDALVPDDIYTQEYYLYPAIRVLSAELVDSD